MAAVDRAGTKIIRLVSLVRVVHPRSGCSRLLLARIYALRVVSSLSRDHHARAAISPLIISLVVRVVVDPLVVALARSCVYNHSTRLARSSRSSSACCARSLAHSFVRIINYSAVLLSRDRARTIIRLVSLVHVNHPRVALVASCSLVARSLFFAELLVRVLLLLSLGC